MNCICKQFWRNPAPRSGLGFIQFARRYNQTQFLVGIICFKLINPRIYFRFYVFEDFYFLLLLSSNFRRYAQIDAFSTVKRF